MQVSAGSDKGADPAGAAESNGGTTAAAAETGVLSQLPRTRPQRSSPRRAAARRAGQTDAPTAKTEAPAKPKTPAARKPAARAPAPTRVPRGSTGRGPQAGAGAAPKKTRAQAGARRRTSAKVPPAPVPRQGFESESDRARGPVRPPGGAELLTSAAEIVGELTKAGFSAGERLMRDALSLLPRS